ncbi:SulP family inorganic anion transporter [Pseudonocardia acaciae]|uniref:SulP family inorganic anion transporter n=1 Tax=Pseudonocardia acaciae TaxID=551276 RepID=UPI000A5473B3|nr:SulP family inorganic anion transporter [Pseudonocardia acaciae]
MRPGPPAPGLMATLRDYRPSWLRADLVAGLTVWAVLVPESLAYATIAGVSPVVGLYAAVASLLLYALIGSSRHLVVGPMSATAALSAAIVAGLAGAGTARYAAFTVTLALVAGVVGVLAGLLRLGFIASLISEPVLKGFIIGLALTIIAGQLPKLFGVEKASGNFFEQVGGLVAHLGGASLATLGVGLAALAVLAMLRKVVPLVPGSLVVVVLGVLAVILFGLDDRGVAIVGPIERGLPSFGLPAGIGLGDYLGLVGPALGVLLVGFAEGLGAAKTYAAKAGYDIDANRELLGLGAANVGAGLSSGMVVNGSLSKTAVNGGAGARSQVSGLTVAALTLLTLLFLTGLFERLPEAVLAAIVIVAVIELVDLAALRTLYGIWTHRLGSIYGPAARADFAAAVAALLGVLVFDTLPGLFIGITVSLLLLLYRVSRPYVAVLGRAPATPGTWVDLARNPEGAGAPGVIVARVESGLFFANADHVRERLRALAGEGTVRAVVLDARTVPFVDVTAAAMLQRLRTDLERDGIRLAIAGDVGQVRDVLALAGGPILACSTLDEAVATVLQRPAPD